ncbi:hypothetical protein IE81DRAFT_331417 [Ceraceosorus guamensis]|uniref:Secreted protein n=1 Tax=Ceraceosorus guamensis TaxID=1522189 RepID=A0A316VSX4_9BASI|nr:hypothetical protein IE81DRAFT_331417 [Ceraceosorus guamensis]PWN40739.1 hypothetical protein IE81DRAFT_331417 [Ceraceosorus guamensis]
MFRTRPTTAIWLAMLIAQLLFMARSAFSIPLQDEYERDNAKRSLTIVITSGGPLLNRRKTLLAARGERQVLLPANARGLSRPATAIAAEAWQGSIVTGLATKVGPADHHNLAQPQPQELFHSPNMLHRVTTPQLEQQLGGLGDLGSSVDDDAEDSHRRKAGKMRSTPRMSRRWGITGMITLHPVKESWRTKKKVHG